MKIFIASSTRSKPLVATLKSELEKAQIIDVWPWYREDAFPESEDVLTALINHCKGAEGICRSDFFAVLLTNKDRLIERSDEAVALRDNCIFELGLFIGALGLDPRRCFMISSVARENLPTDLNGRTLIKFEEPENLEDENELKKKMAYAAARIINRVSQHGRFVAPELAATTLAELMMKEAHEKFEGALSESSTVVVGVERSFAPEYQRSVQILRNLYEGISYKYFVSDLEPNSIASLIQGIATTNLTEYENEGLTRTEMIMRNLKLLQEKLSINLSPGHAPFGFRIHMVDKLDIAVCYAKQPYKDKYFEWNRGGDAFRLAEGLKKTALYDEDLYPVYIIRPTRFFDLESPENASYLRRVKRAVIQGFPVDLQPEVERVCFGVSIQRMAAAGGS